MEIVSLLDDINDECYSIYFPDVDQHQILNNTYFAIEKKSKASRKDNNKSKSKNKCNKLEWFESLEVHQRLEAVSTILQTISPSSIRSRMKLETSRKTASKHAWIIR